MPRIPLSSLRSRAILLVLLAVLPLLALTLYSHVNQRNRAIYEVQRDELVTARNMVTALETLIRSARQLLATLALTPQLQHRDSRACRLLFQGMLRQSPFYANIAATDAEGRVFACAQMGQGPMVLKDRPFFQKTLQTLDFVVGDPVPDQASGKYHVNLSFPILNNQGEFQGVVVVGMDLEWLVKMAVRSELPPSTAVTIADAGGRILFRYPESAAYTGKIMPPGRVKAMAGHNEGLTTGPGMAGDERIFAFVRLPPPWQDLRLVVGLPAVWALAGVNEELRRNLTWLGLVALFAMLAAWYGAGTFLIQPLKRLTGVTAQLAGGNLQVRAGPAYPGGELGSLARAFDGMADALEARDAELKQAAEELRQRLRELNRRTLELEAANKEMEDFTYTVSHDLRAPLRSMGGFARVMLEDLSGRLDADGERYLNIIHQEARNMGQLIDDLLALTRLGRRELTLGPIDMTELARRVWEDVRVGHKDRELEIEIQPLPGTLGDQAMIRQLLAHLLENAVKFTKGRRPAQIQVSGRSEGDEDVYCIKDDGVGFDMKYENKIYEVFQRMHPQEEFAGTGIGLAIVKRIVVRHGGRVWAESKAGEGAVFCFALPKKGSP